MWGQKKQTVKEIEKLIAAPSPSPLSSAFLVPFPASGGGKGGGRLSNGFLTIAKEKICFQQAFYTEITLASFLHTLNTR